MMSVVEKVYETTVRNLSEADRRRLVRLIVDGLREAPADVDALPGYSDEWTREDIADLRAYVGGYAEQLYPEEDIV